MVRSHRAWLWALAGVVAVLTLLPAGASAARTALLSQTYAGLGSWIDIFDGPAWNNPERAVDVMSRRGATILFLQTASSRPGPAVFRPDRTERFLRAAHVRGMTVIAWYLPPWRRPSYETRRALRAIRFERNAERFDGFALDIETAEGSPGATTRNRRLLAMSRRLRKSSGPLYPLGAITPSPAGLDMPHGRRWWPGFPWRRLNRIYDAFLPMGYYTYHAKTAAGAYRDTRMNIELLRRGTGDPAVPIHLIGGGAGESNAAEGRAFARAANRYGVIGASMYDQMTMGAEDWRAVRSIRFRPVSL
jgi:hypothetical protein